MGNSGKAEPNREQRGFKGYMSLEAALVFPAVFALIIMLLYTTFFLYDRCRMTQDLYTAAYRLSIVRNGKVAEPKIDTSDFFMLSSCETSVSGGSTAKAGATGQMAPALLIGMGERAGQEDRIWEIRVIMEARKTDPPQSFRRYRRIATVARMMLAQGEN